MRCDNCGLESPPGMRFCGGCGARLPGAVEDIPRSDSRSAHRRHMTVMFCDIVGSTPIAEMLDAEDFREVLSAYQHACARAIEPFRGYTARFAGDGLMIYFGYPRAHEDSARNAVGGGLAILEELGLLNDGLAARYGVSLRVRIGIHTGTVVAGEMGTGERREPLAIVGETPHIAARLESIAEPDTVVISDDTRDLIEGYFDTVSLGSRELKGVSRPMGIHRVVRSTGAVGRLEVTGARRLTPLVGRDPELARLAQAWQHARGGAGQVVHLHGEAGIGKSRIVRELIARLGQQRGGEQLWQCSAQHQSTVLHPVTHHLERRFGLQGSDASERQLELMARAVGDAGLEPRSATPLLADLLGVAGADRDGTLPLDARDARIATLEMLETLLLADEAHHPLLLVVEDLHWADPTTVELLQRMLPRLRALPVLCVLTFRPDFRAPWQTDDGVIEVGLGPLSSENVRALAAWASPKAVDPAVLDWVDSAADGVPLFVEETLKMLEHAGQLQGAQPDSSFAAVPPTLQGLLTERLDRLPDLGGLIDVAAVLGREFDRGLLEVLWPADGPELEPALVALAAQDVVRPVPSVPTRCEFSHALLQEAAYERILRRDRQVLHGRVARSIVANSTAAAEREPEVVAHHWSCAAQPEKAVRYWHAAGSRALDRAAFQEASHHFRRGLEELEAIGPDPGDDLERVDFLTHLGAALQAGHGYAAAGVDDAYAAARAGAERANSPERLWPVIRGEWLFHLLRSDYAVARELADEMLALGDRQGDDAALAEGHLALGFTHMYVGTFEHARDHFEEAFTRYRRPERTDHVYEAQGEASVMALAYQALVLWNLGYADRSRDRSDLSLQLVERGVGPVTRAQAWGMRSILHLTRGETVDLSYWIERTRRASIDFNVAYWRTVAAVLSAWQRGRDGALSAGIAALEESLDEYLASGSRLSLPHFCVYLADLRLAADDPTGALDAIKMGEEHIAATGEGFAESELYRFKGRVLMALDTPDTEAAAGAYERAVRRAREQNARLLTLRAATRLAVHQARTGVPRTALDEVARLCAWFGASELPDVGRARMLLAQGSRA